VVSKNLPEPSGLKLPHWRPGEAGEQQEELLLPRMVPRLPQVPLPMVLLRSQAAPRRPRVVLPRPLLLEERWRAPVTA